ncbi:MAG TPA: glycosyltransferase family 2 protein [Acidimicrobiales bacterium]|nr:glycosyltransferase family 2 protein [Acidimicrobiales bacterium]
MTTTSPHITVVMCTYNRADLVEHTVRSVLRQEGPSYSVVVVDDGSTDATPKVLAAIDDNRLRVVRQPNGGLSVARNTGIAAVEGDWVVFLDDDDIPEPGWLSALARPMDEPDVGVTCCGSIAVDPDGHEIAPLPVIALPEPFGGVVASYRAGTFAVRTALCRQAGGYLDGLGTSHQFELFMRLQAEAGRQGLRIVSTDVLALRIERRPVDERRSSNPYITYDATSWILSRHPVVFAASPARVAAFDGVRGAAAARFEDWAAARRHFRRSARLEPNRVRQWTRVALAHAPPVGRWVWNRHNALRYDTGTVGVLVQHPSTPDGRARELFLAWGYEERPAADVTGGTPVAASVRRLASRSARRTSGLVLRLDATFEAHDDPVGLLHEIAGQSGDGVPVLLSIVDREVADPDHPLGPPSDPGHRREWTGDQFRLLLRSTGFRVERSWRRGQRLAFLVRYSDTTPTTAS